MQSSLQSQGVSAGGKAENTLSQILHSRNSYFCGFLLAEVLTHNFKVALHNEN